MSWLKKQQKNLSNSKAGQLGAAVMVANPVIGGIIPAAVAASKTGVDKKISENLGFWLILQALP